MPSNRVLALLATAAAVTGAADLSYVERTQVTGGAAHNLTKTLGRFSKGLNEPVISTHTYSGNRKATVSKNSHEIWDLDKETITSINTAEKEYSVITFAEMAKMTAAMAQKMQGLGPAAAGQSNVQWKASFEKNGQTREVAGIATQGGTMKLEMEGADPTTGQRGGMKMDIDMFMGNIPGMEVKQAFDRRVGEKMGAQMGPQMQALAQVGGAAVEAMKEASRRIAALGQMQLASVARMYSDSVPPAAPSGAAGQPSPPPDQPSAGQVVKEEAAIGAGSEAGRRLGGRVGGLGGRLGGRLGRLGASGGKEQPVPQPSPSTSVEPNAGPAAAPALAASGPGLLLETTTEVISYSTQADPSALQVPAFKLVEHPLKKAWGKQ